MARSWSTYGIGQTGRKPCAGLPPFRTAMRKPYPLASRSLVHLKVTSFLLPCQSISEPCQFPRRIDHRNCARPAGFTFFRFSLILFFFFFSFFNPAVRSSKFFYLRGRIYSSKLNRWGIFYISLELETIFSRRDIRRRRWKQLTCW